MPQPKPETYQKVQKYQTNTQGIWDINREKRVRECMQPALQPTQGHVIRQKKEQTRKYSKFCLRSHTDLIFKWQWRQRKQANQDRGIADVAAISR